MIVTRTCYNSVRIDILWGAIRVLPISRFVSRLLTQPEETWGNMRKYELFVARSTCEVRPLGHPPIGCAGSNQSTMMIFLALAHILQCARMSLPPGKSASVMHVLSNCQAPTWLGSIKASKMRKKLENWDDFGNGTWFLDGVWRYQPDIHETHGAGWKRQRFFPEAEQGGFGTTWKLIPAPHWRVPGKPCFLIQGGPDQMWWFQMFLFFSILIAEDSPANSLRFWDGLKPETRDDSHFRQTGVSRRRTR